MTEIMRPMSDTATDLEPTVGRIEPALGSSAGGQRVTITGTGLSNVTRVVFGTEDAKDVRSVDPTRVTCLSPVNVHGPVRLFVVNDLDIQSNKITYTYE